MGYYDQGSSVRRVLSLKGSHSLGVSVRALQGFLLGFFKDCFKGDFKDSIGLLNGFFKGSLWAPSRNACFKVVFFKGSSRVL